MSPVKLEKVESSLRSVLEFFQAFQRQDVEDMLKLASDDCVVEDHYPAPDGTVYHGKGEFRAHLQGLFRDTPEGRLVVEDAYGMGLRAGVEWKFTWPSEGSEKHIRGLDVFEFKDQLISRIVSYVKG